jgi:hypothetical protein
MNLQAFLSTLLVSCTRIQSVRLALRQILCGPTPAGSWLFRTTFQAPPHAFHRPTQFTSSVQNIAPYPLSPIESP